MLASVIVFFYQVSICIIFAGTVNYFVTSFYNLQVMLKNADGALQDFEKAEQLSPNSAHIYFNRANLYASIKQYANADADYSKGTHLK